MIFCMSLTPGERVRELPLFPLPLVLFPNMMLPLHIFEERYKSLVNLCLEGGRRFGVVLAGEENERTGEARMARIGCTARIVRVERLPDGRMNIEVVGEERFRILDSHENQPFRTGVVEDFHDAPAMTEPLSDLRDDVRRLLKEFLRLHLRRMRQEATFSLPDEPQLLSFMASCVLPVDNRSKQTLLEFSDTALRLGAAHDVLEVEVERLQREPEPKSVAWSPITDALLARYRCNN
jgi:ATP-dependent Lon protease